MMIGLYDTGLVQLTYVLPNPAACHEYAQTGVATQENIALALPNSINWQSYPKII